MTRTSHLLELSSGMVMPIRLRQREINLMSSEATENLISERWASDQAIFDASEIWAVLTYLGENGHEPTSFLSAAGVELASLLDPAIRWSLSNQVDVHRAAALARLPDLAVEVGRRLHLSTFGIAGFAVLSASTVGKALFTLVEFSVLLGFKARISIQYGDAIQVSLHAPKDIDRASAQQFLALDLMKLLTFLRDILGPRFVPLRLSADGMNQALKTSIDHYSGTVTESGSPDPRAEIVLDGQLYDRPLPQRHRVAHHKAVGDCKRVITGLRSSKDLRFVILERLHKLDVVVPNFGQISRELGMSERTLRRRLEKIGTSFSQILDERREKLAQRYLRDATLTTESVAELLGYSDAANFRHAFKRWTGKPPSTFRNLRDGEQHAESVSHAGAITV